MGFRISSSVIPDLAESNPASGPPAPPRTPGIRRRLPDGAGLRPQRASVQRLASQGKTLAMQAQAVEPPFTLAERCCRFESAADAGLQNILRSTSICVECE